MSTSASNEYAQFRKTFFDECAEILADMEARVGALQAGKDSRDDLNAIFRAVHSIKAGAGAFGFAELVQFSHIFEALLDKLRDGHIPDERISTTLIRAADILSALVAAAQEDRPIEDGFGADVAEELRAILQRTTGAPAIPAAAEATRNRADAEAVPAGAKPYRIAFRPFAELFRHANEPLLLFRELRRLGALTVACDQSKLPRLASMEPDESYLAWTFELRTTRGKADIAEVFEFVDQDCELTIDELSDPGASPAGDAVASQRAASDAPAAAPADSAKDASLAASVPQGAARSGASSIRVDIARVDRLVNMAGELVITQAMLAEQIAGFCREQHQGQLTIEGHENLATLTRELQECVMAIRMQPVRSVFARMPRLVRDIAAKLGKSVRFITSGEQTEVDKTVIEELADPLTHMIRNAVDHGVETPEIRRAAGKPEEGLIQLSASHVGSNILITIADDGAGIDRERLLAKAIEKGIVPPGTSLTDDEIEDLIFAPGMSTAKAVTDVSGRGVGMDVVRRNITNLSGRVTVHSTPGKGTRFTLIIPLTLAVLDGMVVAVGSERYILPLTSIIESFGPAAAQLRGLAGSREVVSIRGEFFRVLHLNRVFNVRDAATDSGLIVLVETAGGEKVGLKVDELLGQQQVVIKSLQENFRPVNGISGATILGNGRVALILDIEQITRMTSERSTAGQEVGRVAFATEQSADRSQPVLGA